MNAYMNVSVNSINHSQIFEDFFGTDSNNEFIEVQSRHLELTPARSE